MASSLMAPAQAPAKPAPALFVSLRRAYGSCCGSKGGDRTVDVVVARLPVADRQADRLPFLPDRAAHPGLAALLDSPKDLRGALVGIEAEKHLVDDDLVHHLGSDRLYLLRESRCVVAAALDQLPDAGPAERSDRGVDGESAGSPRELRRPVDLVAGPTFLGLDQVLGAHGHRSPVRL